MLGRGGYGKVLLVQLRRSGETYAMKVRVGGCVFVYVVFFILFAVLYTIPSFLAGWLFIPVSHTLPIQRRRRCISPQFSIHTCLTHARSLLLSSSGPPQKATGAKAASGENEARAKDSGQYQPPLHCAPALQLPGELLGMNR